MRSLEQPIPKSRENEVEAPSWVALLSEKYFKLVAGAWAAAAVLMTLFAVNYHSGYVRGFGLPEALFPMDWQALPLLAHRSLVSVWTHFIFHVVDEPLFLLGCAMVGLVLCFSYAFHRHTSKPRRLTPRQRWMRRQMAKPWVMRPLVAAWSAMAALVFVRALLVGFALFLLLPLAAYEGGTRDAARRLEARGEGAAPQPRGFEPNASIVLKTLDAENHEVVKIVRGRIVVGNDKWIGLLTDSEVVVYPMALVRIGIDAPLPPAQKDHRR